MNVLKFIESNITEKAKESIEDILSWIDDKNQKIVVDIKKTNLLNSNFWYYDEFVGFIRNQNKSFFEICGLKKFNGETLIQEQPVIVQSEIGYLGILCKEIDGVIHFLMQAKIEPGNINKIQISPTIQATKSNFLQKHGGNKPAYFDWFVNAKEENIIVDQIQSEQSSRFYKKRNRNIIIQLESNQEIEILESHKWMTLNQIKRLMKLDNIVNMDTRTVLSCIPYSLENIDKHYESVKSLFRDKSMFYSMFDKPNKNETSRIFNYINDYKMFNDIHEDIVPLNKLDSWHFIDNEFISKHDCGFKVIFCDIEIEGREVRKWSQPLFEAVGLATFGLFTRTNNGVREFLVQAKPEIGCFDQLELAPTIQLEPNFKQDELNVVEQLFINKYEKKEDIVRNVILSEEGGRFYHEQNYNIIIEVGYHEVIDIPKGYFWVRYYTLNQLTQVNNVLNIQLRNLLSLLEV